ncbi:hypothetical protein P154DRAFT_536904 [Amniculicola lignicola CBS 123094]|uniref:Uncharacterized protein n=1 Tax=Amniculicola lignicola CBS 123094 TaxID=1392246 RepID=A0A6A5W8I2_9PLEO|nr:hypothetical protein P154DRAFT_536904 [Amniculicola lignicola CBS 123094]
MAQPTDTAQPQRTDLLGLPNELIIEILRCLSPPSNQLHPSEYSSVTATKTLAAVARTCQRLGSLVGPILYSRLEIHQDQVLSQSFFRTIAARPELAAHIETILIERKPADVYAYGKIPFHLRLCSGRSPGDIARQIEGTSLPYGSQWIELLQREYVTQIKIALLLQLSPNLEYLDLSYVVTDLEFPRTQDYLLDESLSHFHSLIKITGALVPEPSLADRFSHLHILRLNLLNMTSHPSRLFALPKLHTLQLDHLRWPTVEEGYGFYPEPMPPQSSSITTLMFSYSCISAPTIARMITDCKTLRRFHQRLTDIDNGIAQQVVWGGTCFPSLLEKHSETLEDFVFTIQDSIMPQETPYERIHGLDRLTGLASLTISLSALIGFPHVSTPGGAEAYRIDKKWSKGICMEELLPPMLKSIELDFCLMEAFEENYDQCITALVHTGVEEVFMRYTHTLELDMPGYLSLEKLPFNFYHLGEVFAEGGVKFGFAIVLSLFDDIYDVVVAMLKDQGFNKDEVVDYQREPLEPRAASSSILPNELLITILESIRPQEKTCHNIEALNFFTKTLAAVALTCRQFNLIATPILYSRYDVQRGQPLQQSFCHTIYTRPDLAKHIKSISIVNRREIDGELLFDYFKHCARRTKDAIKAQIQDQSVPYGERWIRDLLEPTTHGHPDLEIGLILLSVKNVEYIDISFASYNHQNSTAITSLYYPPSPIPPDTPLPLHDVTDRMQASPYIAKGNERGHGGADDDTFPPDVNPYWAPAYNEPMLQTAESILHTPGPLKHFTTLRSLRLNMYQLAPGRMAFLLLLPALRELEIDHLSHGGYSLQEPGATKQQTWPIKSRSSSVETLRLLGYGMEVSILAHLIESCKTLRVFECPQYTKIYEDTEWEDKVLRGLLAHRDTLKSLTLTPDLEEDDLPRLHNLDHFHALQTLNICYQSLVGDPPEMTDVRPYLPQHLQTLEIDLKASMVTDEDSPNSLLQTLHLPSLKSLCLRYSDHWKPIFIVEFHHLQNWCNDRGIDFKFTIGVYSPGHAWVEKKLSMLSKQGFTEEEAYGHIAIWDNDCYINIRDWVERKTREGRTVDLSEKPKNELPR